MFDKEYSFKGTYAEKVVQLTAKFDEQNQLFNRNYDVYLMAPIVGFLYQKKSEYVPVEGNQKSTKVFADIQIKNQDNLIFNYRLIMLLDKKHAFTIEERIDKAFRNFNSDRAKEDELLYDQYVLGGVDILFEKLISSARTSEEYLTNLYDFMEDMDERYNQEVKLDDIADLCKSAKM